MRWMTQSGDEPGRRRSPPHRMLFDSHVTRVHMMWQAITMSPYRRGQAAVHQAGVQSGIERQLVFHVRFEG